MLELIAKQDPAPRLRQLTHAVSVAVLVLGARLVRPIQRRRTALVRWLTPSSMAMR
ncbi:hypothetical protein [Janthinobacterium sp. ROICE36]|uniref:hypothetical protein n=1 Tax=Janthinobacterium sp. ROICE36 TaxID=2048670 RepID=UPI0015E0EA63|nr:hypothetical protein [Janthinobacterium sp. ROICE36]